MDLTRDLIIGTSMEVDIQIPDEVSAIDNSLDSEESCHDYRSTSLDISDCGDSDHLCDADTSFVSEVSSDSLYLPTPQKLAKQSLPVVPMPKKICFVDLTSLGNFIEQLNRIRKCATPGCNGNIVPM